MHVYTCSVWECLLHVFCLLMEEINPPRFDFGIIQLTNQTFGIFSYIQEPIDHMRLDITLDLWKGMSTMLNDGSLLTFVKQLSFEYDLNRKNATQVREMFAITRWLNRQGFLLAHSQPTKLSGKSYALLYVNTKMGTMLNDEGKFNQELVV